MAKAGLLREVYCDDFGFVDPNRNDCIAKFVRTELVPLVDCDVPLITFDGFDDVGKSTLADRLAEEINAKPVHLDDFVDHDQVKFFDALNYAGILNAIQKARKDRLTVIIEGCLIDAVMSKIGFSSYFRFYVLTGKRSKSDHSDECLDESDSLFGDKTAAELIAEKELKEKSIAENVSMLLIGPADSKNADEVCPLKKELIEYHCEFRPQFRAHVLIKRMRGS